MGLPVATLQQLEVATTTLCSQTWSEVRLAPPWATQRAQPAHIIPPVTH